MTNHESGNNDLLFACARCGGPVHGYSETDKRAACERCEDWCPVKPVEASND